MGRVVIDTSSMPSFCKKGSNVLLNLMNQSTSRDKVDDCPFRRVTEIIGKPTD